MKLKLILPITLLLSGNAWSQTMSNTPGEEQETYERGKLGLKMGICLNYWQGKEIPNARLATGMQAGIIFANKEPNKGKLGMQYELSLGHAQYRFNNADLGKRGITRISVNQISAPLTLHYGLSDLKTDRYKSLFVGLSPSFTANSSAQVSSAYVPIQKDNYLAKWNNLPLNAVSIGAVAGYQIRGPIVGFQLMFKNSITNLNNNFKITDAVPETGNGNPIRFFNLEASLLF